MRLAFIDDKGNESEVSKKVNEAANKAVVKAAEVTTKLHLLLRRSLP